MTDKRSIELSIEVPGTPEEVWRAIGTGPGITSWYVPHSFDEHEGAAATASFGPGPEMQVTGRVSHWEPPYRFANDGGEGVDGLAFEWTVEATDGGTCIVRLVNSGFGSGEPWDAEYDCMHDGWLIFLANLRLHLEHFSGQTATPILPMEMWSATRDEAWQRLTGGLGIDAQPAIGSTISTTDTDAPLLEGTVVGTGTSHLTLLIDKPAPGTAFVAAEVHGDAVGVSVWCYLYGADAADVAAREEPQWRSWLAAQA